MIGPILPGEKVILKPIKISEAENFLRWLKDEKVNKFLTTKGKGLNLKKEIEYIKKIRKHKTKIDWSIYTKDGKHIGNTGLKEIDKKNKKSSWGIFIGEKSYWGQGYGTDTLETVLKFCFNKLKLNRVELSVDEDNVGGIKCYSRCGFRREGARRQAVAREGRFIDEIIMGILKSEFKN